MTLELAHSYFKAPHTKFLVDGEVHTLESELVLKKLRIPLDGLNEGL